MHKSLFVKCLQMMRRNAYQCVYTCMHVSEWPHVHVSPMEAETNISDEDSN